MKEMEFNILFASVNFSLSNPYCYVLIPFLIGMLNGFRPLLDAFRDDARSAIATLPGTFFLMIRGCFPAVIYIVVIASGVSLPVWLRPYWATAMFCGIGTELILHTDFASFFVQDRHRSRELSIGPIALLRWFESFFMQGIASKLAESRKQFLKEQLAPEVSFQSLLEKVYMNLNAFPADERTTMRETLNQLKAELETYEVLDDPSAKRQKESIAKQKLGYLILNKFGRKGVEVLLSR